MKVISKKLIINNLLFIGKLKGTNYVKFFYLGIIFSHNVVTRKMVNYTCVE